MRLLRLSVIISILLLGGLAGTADAVMVDFELPDYIAGSTFNGVDGWAAYSVYGGSVVVTDSNPISGSQSGRITGIGQTASLSVMARQFDAGGPTEFGTGSIISGYMQTSGTSGRAEFFYSDDPYNGTSPCGISANIDTGIFDLYGKVGGTGGYIPTISFSSNKNYYLELELNLETQGFNAYATNVSDAGPRTLLGSAIMQTNLPITPDMYPTSGYAIVTRGNAIAVYDDLDVYAAPAIPPVPLLPEPVDFEDAVYVAGSSVIGVDGWRQVVWVATTEVTNTDVLEGTKSLKLSGENNAVDRHFGPDTTYEDASIMSARMKLLSSATQEGQAGLYFSPDLIHTATPAGIVGVDDGNFWIFGWKNGAPVTPDGIDTGIPFLTGVEYLLEMQFNFTNQTFDSYVTNLTAGGERTLLGNAEFWSNDTILPGDAENSGYSLVTRRNTVVIFDELNMVAGEFPPTIPGDANRNGIVDAADAAILAANWMMATGASWADGDFNDDGAVNDIDATLLASNWQTGGSASVPEPSMLAVIFGLLIGAFVMRRR